MGIKVIMSIDQVGIGISDRPGKIVFYWSTSRSCIVGSLQGTIVKMLILFSSIGYSLFLQKLLYYNILVRFA